MVGLSSYYSSFFSINLKIDFASVVEQIIIPAPISNSRIVIQSLYLSCLINNTVTMKSGVNEIGKMYVHGFCKDYEHGMALGLGEAFTLTALAADPIFGQVCYFVEAV